MTEAQETLRLAFAFHLKSGAALLYAWKGNLTNERASQLADYEAKGLRIGLTLTIPADRWIATVVLVDAAGGITVLEEIALALGAGSLALN